MKRLSYLPDNFTLVLLATVTLASLFPAQGRAAHVLSGVTEFAVALLFFLHGAKLSREAILRGVTQWRLHGLIFASTFIAFPLVGFLLAPVLTPLVTPELYRGVLFLCMLPATVQSAIAFTSMAEGNVPAAICSASASTVLGVFLTPLLVRLLILPESGGASSLGSIGNVVVQLFVPFVAGHLLRPWFGGFVKRRASVLSYVDRGSILLVVYGAFGAAVMEGLWTQIPGRALVGLVAACAIVLALVLGLTTSIARLLGLPRADEITLVFCGSKKSLASGVPMAQLLFAPGAVGMVVLPLMIFHQLQLMVCSMLAQRYRRVHHRDNVAATKLLVARASGDRA